MQKSDSNLFPVKAAQEFLSFIYHTTQATGNVLYLLRIRVYSKKCPRIMKMCLLLHTPIVIFATKQSTTASRNNRTDNADDQG
jgi:hypothetical protein